MTNWLAELAVIVVPPRIIAGAVAVVTTMGAWGCCVTPFTTTAGPEPEPGSEPDPEPDGDAGAIEKVVPPMVMAGPPGARV